ncbi:DNA/RNA nuclease SfsA [Phytohalomonas tamaricis]|uniref:DNA/RNA nuclease SfsA n=1 Tax=Phytohalomonas tamaricis TaxID=2081032 RepID=UPI000D0B17C5|nr:DNA/RNA nuclease SfsA [Phytohalomonas tamaricis]
MILDGLQSGVLLCRYKRFLADIRLDSGEEITAHCPNTGSMRAVNVPGCRVWVSRSDNPKRKLAWTWELIELPDGALASIHTGRANALVAEAITAGIIAPLNVYASSQAFIKREAKVEDARLDFCLSAPEQPVTYVEVKQVTLKEPDGHGYFPDAVSERGRRHLKSLETLAAQGYGATLLFCVAHNGIADVAPAAHLDWRYAETLERVAQAGVNILAYGCDITPSSIKLVRQLPVRLRSNKDQSLASE